MDEVRIGRHTVTFSNWDKLLFPVSGITKGDLISYYERIAPIMLPHIKNRPITMKRYPKGINKDGFFHKNTPKDVLSLCSWPSFLMTTGSRGLHVVVPLKRVALFDRVRSITRDIAVYSVKQHPRLLTIKMRKINRGKKIFIDYLRNFWAQTAVAPYAIRARPDAPIATPIRWEELKNKITSSNQYTVKTIFRRLARTGDIWNNMMQSATTLTGIKDCIQKKVIYRC